MNSDKTTYPASPEQKRFRIALTCLILGLVCVLWAWANWIYRASSESQRPVRPQGSSMTIQPGNDASVANRVHFGSLCRNDLLLLCPAAHRACVRATGPMNAAARFAGVEKSTHDA